MRVAIGRSVAHVPSTPNETIAAYGPNGLSLKTSKCPATDKGFQPRTRIAKAANFNAEKWALREVAGLAE